MRLTNDERDSTELAESRIREAMDTFHDQGYLILENAFPSQWIDEVRQECAVGLDAHLSNQGGLAGLAGKTFGTGHVAWFPPLVGLLADDRLVAHPVIRPMLETLLGTGYRSSFHNTNSSFPGSGLQPVHRDHGFLFGNRGDGGQPSAQVVVNVCLCDFTIENGATELWPATHWIPDPANWESAALEQRARELPSIRLVVPAGTLVLRDLRLWHRGMPNTTHQVRSMTATVFQRAWMDDARTSIPETTWEQWSPGMRDIFRHNPVVPDSEHQPRQWYGN